MTNTAQKIAEIKACSKVFRDASPDVIGSFKKLRNAACNDEGVLSYKTKELIALAVSVARKCEPCILSHLEAALELGTTREELVEALNVAILLCGGPGVSYAASTLAAYDELTAK